MQLTVDRDYRKGERVYAWCGPQPNSRLILNYGIVDEGNPYDKLTITATLPSSMPNFQTKRRLLDEASALLLPCVWACSRWPGAPSTAHAVIVQHALGQARPFVSCASCSVHEIGITLASRLLSGLLALGCPGP